MSVGYADLIAAVRETPTDHGPRMVLADWFQERGEPRGEFITAQCQLSKRGLDPASRGQLKQRVKQLFARHGSEWLAPIQALGSRTRTPRGQERPDTQGWDFRLGFLYSLAAPIDALLDGWDALFAIEPIAHIEVEDATSESIGRLAESGILARVQRLTIRGEIGDKGVVALVEGPGFAGLERLNLRGVGMTDDSLPRLCNVSDFQPEVLTLTDNQITDHGAAVLARSPMLDKLVCLYLSRTQLADDGVASLAQCPRLGRLERLTLGALEELTEQGAQALLESPYLISLRYLELDQCFELDFDMIEKLADRYGTVRT